MVFHVLPVLLRFLRILRWFNKCLYWLAWEICLMITLISCIFLTAFECCFRDAVAGKQVIGPFATVRKARASETRNLSKQCWLNTTRCDALTIQKNRWYLFVSFVLPDLKWSCGMLVSFARKWVNWFLWITPPPYMVIPPIWNFGGSNAPSAVPYGERCWYRDRERGWGYTPYDIWKIPIFQVRIRCCLTGAHSCDCE